MILHRVTSGGQTGVGPVPTLAGYGLVECSEPRGDPPPEDTGPIFDHWVASLYPPRTRANARDSDATLWIGPVASQGFRATERACLAFGKPFLIVPEDPSQAHRVIEWVDLGSVRVLNVAGDRESSCPGIGERAERLLLASFRQLQGSS